MHVAEVFQDYFLGHSFSLKVEKLVRTSSTESMGHILVVLR